MQLDISVMLPLISKICYAIVKTGLQMRKNNKYQSIKMPYLVTYRPKEINKNLYLSSNFLGNIFFFDIGYVLSIDIIGAQDAQDGGSASTMWMFAWDGDIQLEQQYI